MKLKQLDNTICSLDIRRKYLSCFQSLTLALLLVCLSEMVATVCVTGDGTVLIWKVTHLWMLYLINSILRQGI